MLTLTDPRHATRPPPHTAKNDVAVQEAKDVIARIVKQRGFKLLGVRLLPTDNKELGQSALATEPHVLQVRAQLLFSFDAVLGFGGWGVVIVCVCVSCVFVVGKGRG